MRILAVDNEPSVTLSMRYIFADKRYALTCAESGSAALADIDANSSPYDVIIVDQKMPNQTGVELVGAIRERGMKGKIIVVSAYLSNETRADYARMDVHELFSKPFNIVALRSAVDRLAA